MKPAALVLAALIGFSAPSTSSACLRPFLRPRAALVSVPRPSTAVPASAPVILAAPARVAVISLPSDRPFFVAVSRFVWRVRYARRIFVLEKQAH